MVQLQLVVMVAQAHQIQSLALLLIIPEEVVEEHFQPIQELEA